MTRIHGLCRALALPLAILLTAASLPLLPAEAALVPTERVIEHQASEPGVAADRAKVLAFMARGEVRREFQALGVDADEATARVAALSDVEIRLIAGHIGDDPAGQDVIVAVVGTLIGAAVFVFVVLLITDLIGLTDVFPFVNKPARR